MPPFERKVGAFNAVLICRTYFGRMPAALETMNSAVNYSRSRVLSDEVGNSFEGSFPQKQQGL